MNKPDSKGLYKQVRFVSAIELIRDERESKGITQKEMAEKMGITQASLSRIESGKGEPTLKQVQAMLNILGMSLII